MSDVGDQGRIRESLGKATWNGQDMGDRNGSGHGCAEVGVGQRIEGWRLVSRSFATLLTTGAHHANHVWCDTGVGMSYAVRADFLIRFLRAMEA